MDFPHLDDFFYYKNQKNRNNKNKNGKMRSGRFKFDQKNKMKINKYNVMSVDKNYENIYSALQI